MSDAIITFPILGEGFRLDFKPYFTLFGRNFYWYGVIIAVGFLLAVFYAMKRSRDFGLNEDSVIDMLIYTVPPAIIFARIYYVILYWNEGGYAKDIVSIIKIWEGGLAVYGGLIGGFLGLILFTRVKKIKFGPMADVGALGMMIGQAIGRWGNFTNREAYGVKTNVPWKMGLTNQYGTFYFHPCFLYESLWNILGLILLHFYSKKRRKYDGQIFLMYIVWYGIGRLFIESLRTDSLDLFGTGIRASQLVAVICILLGGGVMIYNKLAKHYEPEDLWVNREKKAEIIAAEEEASRLKKLEIEKEEFDEELSDAFRMLLYKQTVKDTEVELIPEEPAVEPVEVFLSESDDDKE